MKKAVFWDVAPCRSGVNRRFGGTYRLHLQGRRDNIRESACEASVRDVKDRLVILSCSSHLGYLQCISLVLEAHG
jgi:hypothetical protein